MPFVSMDSIILFVERVCFVSWYVLCGFRLGNIGFRCLPRFHVPFSFALNFQSLSAVYFLLQNLQGISLHSVTGFLRVFLRLVFIFSFWEPVVLAFTKIILFSLTNCFVFRNDCDT
jgi:hypothetical protein